ncbi:MAG TPA: SRPBCC family protein [Bryobacteraceae bacterium]|nr:SRPBCC family protein [Bryobacteraceae bacterium]
MIRPVSLLGGAGVGAGLMYLLDPDRGRRRRAITRDKAKSVVRQSSDALSKAARDLGNRALGTASVVRTNWSGEQVDDDVLAARVRTQLGRAVSHPGAIEVSAEQGSVTLGGSVLRHELDPLLSAISSVPGVHEIRNELAVHKGARDIPELQGGSSRERSENWNPAARLVAGLAGGAMAVYGFSRRDPLSFAAALVGTALVTRAATNTDIGRVLGISGGRRAVDIVKTIEINAPVEEVWDFWQNFENFPRFMTHLKDVRVLDEGRSHWVAEGPAGVSVAWNAEITRRIENQVLAWKSTDDSLIRNAGIVRFDPTPNGGTRVHIRFSYNPPAGAVGHAVAWLLGRDAGREMEDDLLRLKSLFEDGKTTGRERRAVTREEVMPGFEPSPEAGA